MNLHDTIKDILKDVNCYLPDDKLKMWTNVILIAIEQDKKTSWKGKFGKPYSALPNPFPLKKEQFCIHGLPQQHCSTCIDEETVASL